MTCPTVIRVTTGTGPPGIGLPAGTGDAGKFVRKAGSTAYAYELVTPDQVGLPQALGTTSSPTFAGLTLGGMSSAVGSLVLVGTNGQLTTVLLGSGLSITEGALNAAGLGGGGNGSYPSLTMPTGFSVSGSGTASLVVAFAAGYGLLTTAKQTEWDSAYSERLRWDGGGAGLNAATGRASLGLAAVAASGAYGDLSGRPTLGTAAATDASTYASAAQGTKADTAVQPAALTVKADLVGGLVPTSQIPAVALVQYLGQAANQSAMLALRGEGGDWCIRTDSSTEWVIVVNNGASLSDWIQLPNGISPVSSINGQTGAVTLGTGDLGESGGNLFFTAARAIGSALTGFVAGAGTVAATDSILQAIQKLAAGAFQNLSATTSLLLPSAAAGTPAAGHLYRIADQLRYRDSTATEQVVLHSGGNLANLANAATARTNLGLTATATASPAGGLSVQSGNLVMTEGIALTISNKGEAAVVGNNYEEKAVDRACSVVGVTFELNPTTVSTSGSSQVMLYARRSGTKTALLTANASLPVTTGIFTNVTANLTGTLTLAAGDSVGADLIAVGTGATGLKLTVYVRYS